MDYLDPLRALIPGVTGAILSVLTHTEQPLTMRQLAERAGSSHPQVGLHIERLERLGLVRRHIAGRSHLVTLTDSAASTCLRGLADLRSFVLAEFEASAAAIFPAPASVTVFGSFARGTAGPSSDIDVLIVRPDDIDPDDDTWSQSIGAWVDAMAELAGSPVAEIVIGEGELHSRVEEALSQAIQAEGVVVAGRSLKELLHAS